MKRKVITTSMIMLLTFAVVVPLVSVPTVSARTLKFKEIIKVYFGYPNPDTADPSKMYPGIPIPDGQSADWVSWSGPLTGDITAMSFFWGTAKGFVTPGNKDWFKVAHFYEDFLIVFNDNGWIIGWDQGIWTFSTLKYRADGLIIRASPDKQNYVGCKFYEEGIVTFWPNGENVEPLGIGIGTGHITGKL